MFNVSRRHAIRYEKLFLMLAERVQTPLLSLIQIVRARTKTRRQQFLDRGEESILEWLSSLLAPRSIMTVRSGRLTKRLSPTKTEILKYTVLILLRTAGRPMSANRHCRNIRQFIAAGQMAVR